jgi:hypothetical protein
MGAETPAKFRYFRPSLDKIVIGRQILVELQNLKCNEKALSNSRFMLRDRQRKEMDRKKYFSWGSSATKFPLKTILCLNADDLNLRNRKRRFAVSR